MEEEFEFSREVIAHRFREHTHLFKKMIDVEDNWQSLQKETVRYLYYHTEIMGELIELINEMKVFEEFQGRKQL